MGTINTMRFYLLVSALVAASLASEDVFLNWAKEQGRQYHTRAELTKRRAIFMKNYNRMVEHNKEFAAGRVSWARGVNQWYDLTEEEWAAELGLGIPQYPEQNMTSSPSPHLTAAAPSSWDWRDHGVVSPIKNQRQCGSCAAFAAVATVESCFAQLTGVITDLSEEHLVNCLATDGCEGWWTNRYLESIVSQNGGRLEQEHCCPYTATDNHCNDDNTCDYTAASISGHYSYGIFDDPNCCEETTDSNCKNTYNHAVTAVGYGSEGGKDFWIVKNQWGTGWGESGYFRIKRGTGHCGFGINHYLTPYC